MKLQQAYFSESNMAGGWQLIGYIAPSGAGESETTNFKYGNSLGITKDQSNALASDVVGWDAMNKINLNECTSGINWKVTLSKKTSSTAGADIGFSSSAGAAGCVALTPTFDKIGQ